MGSLYTGDSGLRASQYALNTTAHNMSNLDTEGYTRQQISLATRPYITTKKDYNVIAWDQTGLGTYYNNCKQVRSVFLDRQYRLESGREEFYDVSAKTLGEVEDQLQELNGTEFADSLNNLWVAVQELAKDPTKAVNQSMLVTRSAEFLNRAQGVYDGLVAYQDNMDKTVKELVEQINDIGDQIRELNEDIVEIESGQQEHANDLRDKRNLLLDQLGELGRIDFYEDTVGNVLVKFEGTQFVTTDHVNHMACDTTLVSPVGYNTPYWEYAAKKELNAKGDWVVTDISGANVFDLTQTVATSTNTDVGKLRATLLARGDHHATYHDITDDPTTNYYNKNVSQSVIMNIEAEFDQMVHNIVTAINEVFENARSNPINLGLEEAEGKPADYYNLFSQKLDDVELNYETKQREKQREWYNRITGETVTEAKKDQDIVDGVYAKDDFAFIWVWPEPEYSKVGYSLSNIQVNKLYLDTPTTLSYFNRESEEDYMMTTALKEVFTTPKYRLNPNVAVKTDVLGYYNMLVSQVANSGSMYNGIQENQQMTVDSIGNAREQIVGTSSDEELEFMIMFQNAFNAASRYVNVVNEMLEHVITQLGS